MTEKSDRGLLQILNGRQMKNNPNLSKQIRVVELFKENYALFLREQH
jgi:hypothetical protein